MSDRLWLPATGSEGEAFITTFCAHCSRDANNDCDILARSFRGQVTEWRLPDGGFPLCTAYLPMSDPPKERCEHTADMFGAYREGEK